LPGVWFRPAAWSPLTGFWQGHELTGVQLVVFDSRRFYAVRTAVEIAVAVRELNPRVIDIKSVNGLDRDWGTDAFRAGLLAGESAHQILDRWSVSTAEFESLRRRYLLYD
jgi:uncharacterized protein YbbC (DUF1343 family)